MILGKDGLTTLGLDLIFSENLIIGGEGPYKSGFTPMFDLKNYNFKYLAEI